MNTTKDVTYPITKYLLKDCIYRNFFPKYGPIYSSFDI